MTRTRLRTSMVVSSLAAVGLAVALSGCGAGQVSQTATQEPAVNGSSAGGGSITLRNVHLRANQSTDYVRPGSNAELLLVASNGSPTEPDRLTSITSDIGAVTVTGKADVAPNGVLVIGSPDGQITPLDTVEDADAVTAQVALSKPISNGLNYPFTFTFEKAGAIEVQVPISAGESQRRDNSAESADTGAHH